MNLPIITLSASKVENSKSILRQKAKKVDIKEIAGVKFQKLISDMVETMHEEKGIGLAAPQIGKSIRLVIIAHKDEPLAMFNPRIFYKSIRKEVDQEGCLSVPGFTDRAGETIFLKAEGLLSRVIQHELDHLDGVLFIDKAENLVIDSK